MNRSTIKTQIQRGILVSLLALLAACGGGGPNSAQLPGGTDYLLTVNLEQTDTQASVAQRYGGEMIAWLDDKAILKMSSEAVSQLETRGISMQNTTLTTDGKTNAPEYSASGWNAWGSGWNAWGSGWNAWSGGWNAWSGGTGTLPTLPSDNRLEFMITKLPQGQAVARNFGQGIKIAVIDTGLDTAHPMFSGRLAPSSEWLDRVGGDSNPQEESGTMYGHGTAVAGLIVQVAPKATILPIRALASDGSGSVSNLIAAVKHATDMGANVINMSLGTTDNASALKNVVDNAISRGIYVVASSGNTGDPTTLYPAGWSVGNKYLISTGSIGQALLLSLFTSNPPSLEILAPGELIMSAYPGSQVGSFTGTSFAAPQISAAVALAMSDTALANRGNLESYLLLSAAPDVTGNYKIANTVANLQRLPDFQRKKALLVSGTTKASTNDNALVNRLTGLGHTVTVKTSSATAADASGMNLVVISATATNLAGTVFRNTAVPVVVWRPDLFDDMGMTGTATDQFGSSTGQTQTAISGLGHPLGAGLPAGSYGVYTSSDVVSWGRPNSAASIAASLPNNGPAALFGYNAGAAMPGLTAPARRVGFFLNANQGGKLTPTGWNLFEAAVTWATSGN